MLPIDQIRQDIAIFKMAKRFLLENTPAEVDETVINSYLSVSEPCSTNVSIRELYHRLLESAQNASMKAGVVGGSIGGVERLGEVLGGFDPQEVLAKYSENEIELLKEIVLRLAPKGKIRKGPKSIWPRYCRTITTSARFFCQFNDSGEFFTWADHFYFDTKSMAALPMIIAAEIYGIAFPLACDFLKELGYVNYGKPDVHIKKIFEAAKLAPMNATNYQVLKAIIRMAENIGVSAYEVDKVFWLIGSGKFYKHKEIGKNGRVGRLRKPFIEYLANHPIPHDELPIHDSSLLRSR